MSEPLTIVNIDDDDEDDDQGSEYRRYPANQPSRAIDVCTCNDLRFFSCQGFSILTGDVN